PQMIPPNIIPGRSGWQCGKCAVIGWVDGGTIALSKLGWDTSVFVRLHDGSGTHLQYCPRHARWWTLRYWARRYSLRLGRISHWLSPGYLWCFCCLTSWDYVHPHTTWWSEG